MWIIITSVVFYVSYGLSKYLFLKICRDIEGDLDEPSLIRVKRTYSSNPTSTSFAQFEEFSENMMWPGGDNGKIKEVVNPGWLASDDTWKFYVKMHRGAPLPKCCPRSRHNVLIVTKTPVGNLANLKFTT